jgi:large subunit ribosomal protein L22
MKTKYAFQGLKENMARAITKDAGISTKASIEIANFIRGKKSSEAKVILERVLKKKQAIPFRRFTDGVGHRKGAGISAGRFPIKACEIFITLIKQCEANAQAKGLSSDLRIVHLVPQQGSNTFRHGRLRRRSYKRTHLEIVLEELEPVKKVDKSSKPQKSVSDKSVDAVKSEKVDKKVEKVDDKSVKPVEKQSKKVEDVKKVRDDKKAEDKVQKKDDKIVKPVEKVDKKTDVKVDKKVEKINDKKDNSSIEKSEPVESESKSKKQEVVEEKK